MLQWLVQNYVKIKGLERLDLTSVVSNRKNLNIVSDNLIAIWSFKVDSAPSAIFTHWRFSFTSLEVSGLKIRNPMYFFSIYLE